MIPTVAASTPTQITLDYFDKPRTHLQHVSVSLYAVTMAVIVECTTEADEHTIIISEQQLEQQ